MSRMVIMLDLVFKGNVIYIWKGCLVRFIMF